MYKPAPIKIDPALLEPAEIQVMGEGAWLATPFTLSCASPDFYQYGARRKIGSAIWFFVIFNMILVLIATVRMTYVMVDTRQQISDAFLSGQIPEITISGGLANVNATQPLVLVDGDGVLVKIDTSGFATQIDNRRYANGMVLTRDSLMVLNNGQYQTIPLAKIQEAFKTDPILINAEMVTGLWDQLTTWLIAGTFLLGLLWMVLVRLVWLLLLASLMRGAVTLFRRKVEYAPVAITGLYAFIPALYLHYLLGRVHVDFIFLQTLILLVIWGIALIPALRQPLPREIEKPNLAPWQMWIGVPMVLALAWDSIFSLPDAVGLVWVIAIVTMLIYVTMYMFMGGHPEESTGQPGPTSSQ
ncbi:MAG TPA: DUF1189 family protein [Anaerolineaceae bacterium]|nr:DUF1189 family protein [Anaerolineaceae bacterium]